jgi:hypothetical protein
MGTNSMAFSLEFASTSELDALASAASNMLILLQFTKIEKVGSAYIAEPTFFLFPQKNYIARITN